MQDDLFLLVLFGKLHSAQVVASHDCEAVTRVLSTELAVPGAHAL